MKERVRGTAFIVTMIFLVAGWVMGWPMPVKIIWAIGLMTCNAIAFDARDPSHWLLAAGALCNLVAVVANGGYMPVLDYDPSGAPTWWVPLTAESRLPWLCDIYWGSSIGDGFIAASVLAAVGRWCVRKLVAAPA